MAEGTPSGSALVRRILLYTGAYAALGCCVISLYLYGLLGLSAEQWGRFLLVVLGAFVLIFPAMVLVHRQAFARLRAGIDANSSKCCSEDTLRMGFVAVSDFPRYWFVWGLFWWGGGSVIVAVGMLIFDAGFGAWRVAVVVTGTLSVCFLTDVYYFFAAKRLLAPLRLALAARLGNTEERARLARGPSLRLKLLASFIACILVSVLYAGFLAQVRTHDAVRGYALRVQARVLESLVGREPFSLAEARRAVAPLGHEVKLALFDRNLLAPIEGDVGILDPAALAWIREQGLRAGDSAAYRNEATFGWATRAGDGHVLVVQTPASEWGRSVGVGALFIALTVLATLVAMGVAYLLARDVDEATHRLGEAAARIAAGDLRHSQVFDSEDELGALGRAFERMHVSLRRAVQGVKDAADQMQATAGAIRSTSSDVAQATEAQLDGLFEAGGAMAEVGQQASGMAGSAERLDVEADGASSSVLELEGTGAELSQSAGALSATVDEVASSVEQLACNAAQVEQGTSGLVEIADDTSGSMNRAAEGMRAVRATADEIARLSSDVATLSEAGRARVRETIEGMAAIHSATDAAERVIEGLTQSAAQIDDVVAVIDSVADETGLLALNAAIIAAQAGDHGRGFAVVAGEIRALANRVSTNTRDIGELVRAVQQETEQARRAIEDGTERVDRGVSLSGDAGESLDRIAGTTHETGERTAEIARTVEEQACSMDGVAELMVRLRTGTGQIDRAIREQGKSTQMLRQSAQSVRDVSKQLQSSTVEQARGTTRIRKSVQSIRESVGEINAGLQQQASTCRQLADRLADLRSSAESNRQSVGRLDEAMGGLEEEAESLSAEASHFRI